MGRLTGSLREALIAAGRDDSRVTQLVDRVTTEPREIAIEERPRLPAPPAAETPPPLPPALGVAPVEASPAEPVAAPVQIRSRGPTASHFEAEVADADPISAPPRTQLVRGRSSVKRTEFHQDPVVGWLVVVGGPGLGAFRPIYEGNNTIGRASTQRIPLDFGDEAISSEEQAYLRYDSIDRKFLLVPNLAKTNIVAVNDKKPTGAVELSPMDLVTVGRTQLAFVAFCGMEFDWSELNDLKG